MLFFIEKNPNYGRPSIIKLLEERELSPTDCRRRLNFALLPEGDENVAAEGSCVISTYGDIAEHLYISEIYVYGNTNQPTKKTPNKHVGLGQILVFVAIKFGFEFNIKKAQLIPLEGSEGFYLKMGFHPEITGDPNRMIVGSETLGLNNGKLNPKWTKKFSESSFLHGDFRGPFWSGDIQNIYPRLREDILKNWDIQQ